MDELDAKQVQELDDAISEADNNDTVTQNDFKKEINEWEKEIVISNNFYFLTSSLSGDSSGTTGKVY